jgi:GT2 family glycosyltransferase
MIPRVNVIILNWNGWVDTVECLESLYQIDYPFFDVVVVDNDSEDDSLVKIREYCQGDLKVDSPFFTYNPQNKPIKITELTEEQIKSNKTTKEEHIPGASDHSLEVENELILIKNSKNHGFAEGNNIAIEYALGNLNPEYILLLNNDTVVDPQFLHEMIKATGEGRIGIIGPKLLNASNPRIIDSAGHIISWGRIVDRGHDEVDQGQYDQDINVLGAMAAAALYKKEMLLEIGLLDSNYITLGEDADLSWRAYNKGWKAIYAPKSRVYHKRGRSITKESVLPRMTLLSTKNTTEYVVRNGSNIHKFQYLFILLKEGLFVLTGSIIQKNKVNTKKYARVLLNSYFKIFKSIVSLE